MNKHYIEPLWRKSGVFGFFIKGVYKCFIQLFLSWIFIKWNMVFLPHICISKIEEYKEGIDVFALAYRNHTDDHYMVADR